MVWRALGGCVGAAPGAQTTEPDPRVADPQIPGFIAPFQGDAPLVNPFDHDLPGPFVDERPGVLTFWGARTTGIEGHAGYDWDLPVGSPVRAVAAGRVVEAGLEPSFFCPLLGRVVSDQAFVRIRHRGADGSEHDVVVRHLQEWWVEPGDAVRQGAEVGSSGASGCATGPHLHFEVWRRTDTPSGLPVVVDPYGWEGPGDDPWARAPAGAASAPLWAAGHPPPLHREITAPHSDASVFVESWRWMGHRDDLHPENEHVVVRNRRGRVSLDGFVLLDDDGARFRFPSGLILEAGEAITVRTGGPAAAGVVSWGLPSGVWDDDGDRVRLVDPSGRVVFELR